mgnify:CR=1 FL=1
MRQPVCNNFSITTEEGNMKNNFKWHKELIDGKWYSVCDHEHVPMIECTKDNKYKLRNANGKAVLHEDYKDAVKLALEVYDKFKKLNKEFAG